MKTITLYIEGRSEPLAREVAVADRFLTRLRGLIGRPPLQAGQGLWIRSCQQVHTHFMRAPIDIVFVDAGGIVLDIVPALRPWRFSRWVRKAESVIELAAGGAGALGIGDRIRVAEPL